MKWIGQHIYDQISRFRNDVYLEDLSTTTETNVLVVDSSGKISKTAAITGDITGIALTAGTGVDLTSVSGATGGAYAATIGVDVSDFMANGVNNKVLTATGADAINAENNLTFDGSTLGIEVEGNTTANALFVDANSLTTGSAIYLDIDDTLTHSATKSLMHIDYDKSGNTASGQSSLVTGLNISMDDAAASNVGAVLLQGIKVTCDAANANGNANQNGIQVALTDGDVGQLCVSYLSSSEDGGIDFKSVSSADSNDYFTIATGGKGVTTLTTVDSDTAGGAHFEIAAGGNIILDTDSSIALESSTTVTGDLTVNGDNVTFQSANADDPIVTIKNTSNATNDMASLKFVKDRGAAPAVGTNLAEIYFVGEDSGQNEQEYGRILCEIDVATHGQESGVLKLGVANHDGGNGYGLTMTGGSLNDEVDVTLGLGAASVVTIPGIIGTGVWNGTAIATAYIADDAVTFAKASGVSPKVFGSTIKILPSDFMSNDDGGATKFGIGFVETDGTSFGMKIPNADTELLAFVSIPEGMKATHVDIFDDSDDRAIEVFEANVNSRTINSKGSGNCNTTLDITDVNATATNYLIVLVTTTATSDRTYGGTITIAAQ